MQAPWGPPVGPMMGPMGMAMMPMPMMDPMMGGAMMAPPAATGPAGPVAIPNPYQAWRPALPLVFPDGTNCPRCGTVLAFAQPFCACGAHMMRGYEKHFRDQWFDGPVRPDVRWKVTDVAQQGIQLRFEREMRRHQDALQDRLAGISKYRSWAAFGGMPPWNPTDTENVRLQVEKANQDYEKALNDSWKWISNQYPDTLEACWELYSDKPWGWEGQYGRSRPFNHFSLHRHSKHHRSGHHSFGRRYWEDDDCYYYEGKRKKFLGIF